MPRFLIRPSLTVCSPPDPAGTVARSKDLVADAPKRAEAVLEIDARANNWRPGGILRRGCGG